MDPLGRTWGGKWGLSRNDWAKNHFDYRLMERRDPATWWAGEVEKLERNAVCNRICVDVILDFRGERGLKIRSDELPEGGEICSDEDGICHFG